MLHKRFRQLIALVLTVALLTPLFPYDVMAHYADPAGRPTSITKADGTTLNITEDWETAFPYGTFAFGNSEAQVTEGGGTAVIQLYRLGGTKGRATASVIYVPAVTQISENKLSYGNAAGLNDVIIEVEDPLPIAKYQPLGKDPDPEPTEVKLIDAENTAADAEPGDHYINMDEQADSYQWYVLSGGEWELVKNANEAGFVISAENFDNMDVRLVFQKNGVSYCTDSVKGAAYVKPESEVLEQIPDDLPLNPDPTFTRITGDSPFSYYAFDVTFAEDEWVKDIKVTAIDDDIAEAIKAGTFTIVDCKGGTLYDSANTLALAVFDNETPESSVIGFSATLVDADKSAGTAKVTVTRTGGTQTMVTVPYSTKDGTAKAGEDYQAVSGSLAFFADVTEQTIEIPLINDEEESYDPVTFQVELGNVVGDNLDLITLGETVATVSLINSNTAEAENLITLLKDGSAVDASGSVVEMNTVAAPVDRKTVTGTQVKSEDERLSAEISGMESEGDGLSLQTYDYGRVTFSRNSISSYTSKYWRNNLIEATGSYPSDRNEVGAIRSWTGDGSNTSNGGRKIEGQDGGKRAYLNIPYMSQMYSYIYASFGFSTAILNTDLYGAEFVYPWASVTNNNNSDVAYTDADVSWDWGLFSGYHYTWYTGGSISHSFDMSSNLKGVTLALSKHDAHNADKGTARIEVKSLYLTRRNLANDMQLRIHTANDGNNSGTYNVETAPDKAAALNVYSGVYGSMKPEVTIVEKQGGINSSGKLYVGSTVQVELKNTDSYKPKTLSEQGLNTAVYISDENGNIISGPQISKVSGTDKYNIKMVWSGMREADLNKTYVINVIMTRKQNLKIDISPSVQRQQNNAAAIDTSKIGDAWNLFWSHGDSTISYGVSDTTKTAPHFSKTGVSTKTLQKTSSWSADSASNAIKVISGLENLQWINFNRSAEDRILYNGRIYAGNETIYLDVADLALPNATFRYYHKDYLSATSIMTTDINSVGIYLDTNGNGQIDGYYNEGTGYFILDDNKDDFIQFLDSNTDYDEATFAPVKVKIGNVEKYVQYFAKVYYTMTPRSLIPPAGLDLSKEKAQVLPAFVTNITDPDNYAELTKEQQSYRYIMSGKNQSAADVDSPRSGYARSSDGHVMYGGEASKPQIIDVPLGGDVSPAHLNMAGDGYEWTPSYQGNLLVDFDNPEPISIEHSLAGDDIPIANYTINENGTVTLESGGAAKINGYLGSFTANSTITLCTQRQEKTADMLHTATSGSMALLADDDKGINPESSNLSTRGSFPNSEYLKAMDAGQDPNEGEIDMGESPNEFDELNLDLGVNLPSTDIALTDYVTIIMDGYEVGFAIGLPLASASNEDGGKGFVDTNKSKGEDMGKVKNFLQNRKGSDVDDSYKNAKNGDLNAGGVEASLSVSAAFLFKYNSVDNGYYFSQFAIALTGSVEFKYQHRFAPAPVVYLYVKVGGELKLGTGATVERETVESDDPWCLPGKDGTGNTEKVAISKDNPLTLKKGSSQTFLGPKYKAQNITFKGKVAIQLQEKDGNSWKDVPKSIKGYLQSDGGDPITVTLLKQDEMKLPDIDTAVYRIKVTALEDTTITGMVEVTNMTTKSYWSGFKLEPSVFVEAGAGIGIEILKFEIFIKVSVECGMTFGVYNDETDDYDGFQFDEFSFGLGLGFRVVLLVINYEMDLIGYSVDFDQEARNTDPSNYHSGWSHSWHALGDLFGGEIDELSAVDKDGNYYGVKITLPGDTSRSQTIYSNTDDGLSLQAYTPSNADVPFQYSGYGSSGDAFKLADGLITGYDYQVVTAGDTNYLIYTISRQNAGHAVDNTMLVLSKLQLTSSGGKDSYGLVNPLDISSATPYILLDTKADGSDDGTGDLDFRAWAEGNTIHAAWVSYATKADITAGAVRPAGDPPKQVIGGVQVSMDQDNYTEFTSPENPGNPPAVVSNPGDTKPDEPQESDYYLLKSEADYNSAADGENEGYVAIDSTDTSKGYYKLVGTTYSTYIEAKTAYDLALSKYNSYDDDKAQYDAYVIAQAEYDGKLAAYNAFSDWTAYFSTIGGNVQAIAANAAKNTVVKTASFDASQTNTGFTAAETVSGAAGTSLVYLPGGQGDGSVTVYAKAVPMEDSEKTAAKTNYTTYLAKIGYDPDGTSLTGDNSSKSAKRTIGNYRLATQVGMWDAYGKGTDLYVSVDGTPCANPLRLAENQILDNFEVTKIGDIYYLTYTTSEKVYTDASGNKVADVANAAVDMVTIKRLFLRTFTVANDGTVTWTNHGTDAADASKAVLLRTLYDFDVNAGTNKDGIYANGGISNTGAYNDPYFSNLKFLNGKLGDSLTGTDETFTLMNASPEEFLLFEMNGATFVIKESSLKSIVGSSHTGQIIPFFAYEDVTTTNAATTHQPKTTHAESTGRSQATIGADGDGNISAVYLAPVTGTSNNAIYLSKYDPNTASWGAGTMLAMNHMDVYEDSITANWDADKLDKAYLGKLENYDKGAMDEFTFGNLQIALGQTKTDGGEPGSAVSGTGSSSNKSTLLILTQGTTSYLDTYTTTVTQNNQNVTKEYVGRMNDAKAATQYKNAADGSYWKNRKPGVGVYALSFGVGGQAIGEASLTFANYDFTAGAYLHPTLSFTNTGDVGIRGSQAQPITVTLNASGSGLTQSIELAKWTIDKNIVPGQKVELTGEFTLDTSLPQNTVISATITEDDYYENNGGGIAYCATTETLLTVADKPELGFESLTIKPKRVDDSGNVILEVDGLVGNRGTKDATNVTLQFSYDNGQKDSTTGNSIFTPLNITGHTMEIGEEQDLTTLAAAPQQDLAHGILLMSDGTSSNIGPGKGRTIKGEIKVSPDKFKALTDSLSINVEIFCNEDPEIITDSNNMLVAQHVDYNSIDNLKSIQVEHDTFFSVASKVVIPMGNTLRLPVSLAATTGDTVPQVVVTEFPDAGGSNHLGVLYYQPGAYSKGNDKNATLVLAPSSTGSGLIRLQDTNTNGFFDVAYAVTEAAEGINIFNDTTIFNFYNDTNKTNPYDPTALAGTQNWSFDSAIDKWGADETAPYLDNLARGKVGACFTFDTKAESIDLIFGGKVKVESTFPGFNAQTLEANGGDGKNNGEHASVRFGANATNYTHTVTITVLAGAGTSDVASFDRLVEKFGNAGTPVPADDAAAPHIYWSRSFPDTASIDSDTSTAVPLTVYILDDGQLASVSLNGSTFTETSTGNTMTVHSSGYWELPMTITENGFIHIAAMDTAGNRTAQNITVDWFNKTISLNTSAETPSLNVALKKTDKLETEIANLTASDAFTKDNKAFIQVTAAPSASRVGVGDATVTIEFITIDTSGTGLSSTPVGKRTTGVADGMYPMDSNGWYLVTVRNPAPYSNEFSSMMVLMDRIDTNIPVVTLSASDSSLQTAGASPVMLDWSVQKQNTGTVRNTIKSVTINGKAMAIASGQTAVSGSFQTNYGGFYTAVATDTAGNTGDSGYNLENVPVRLASGMKDSDLFTIQNAAEDNAGSKANGTITISDNVTSVIVGGTYLETLSESDKAAGNYVGSYEWNLVYASEPATGEALNALLAGSGWTTNRTLSGKEPGNYVLYVRDKQEPTNAATVAAFTLLMGDETITVNAAAVQMPGQDAHSVDWTVDKGIGAIKPITAVTINGYTVYTQNIDGDTNADGSFPVLFAGDYNVVATDGVNTAEFICSIGADDAPIMSSGATSRVDDPLSTTDDVASLITINNPWNQAGNNGIITIDPTVIVGGQYYANDSQPALNQYKGSYEWTLYELEGFDRDAALNKLTNDWLKDHPEVTDAANIPSADMDAINAEADRLQQSAEATPVGGEWSNKDKYEDMEAGTYKLVVRDKQNPNSTNALTVYIKLKSDATEINATSVSASSADAKDGQVIVTSTGGYGQGGTYEFIIRPIINKDAAVEISKLNEALDPNEYPQQAAPEWLPATMVSNTSPNFHVFTDMPAGWYQVAVRPMLGVTLEDMTDLTGLYNTYTSTLADLNAAEAAAQDSAKEKAVKKQIEAIDQALSKWQIAAAADKQDAWEAYIKAFDSNATQLDATIQAAFDAWQAANFSYGSEQTAYNTAVETYVTNSVTVKTDANLVAARAAFLTAKDPYETKLQSLQSKSASYYGGANAQYWDNAATTIINVKYNENIKPSTKIQPNDLTYPDEDTVEVEFSPTKAVLSDEVEQKLIEENATRDILATSPTMTVLIPKGTLSEGDSVSRMLMPFANIPEEEDNGNVVVWIGSNGETEIAAWSHIGPDNVAYIADKPGSYSIIKNEVEFVDVPESFWGYDEISFTAARAMFNGVGDGKFDPNGTMTRGMFVTVLGRIAGVDLDKYKTSAFNDVDSESWYGPYVAWAAERGIVNGMGEGIFDPNSPVTREQICTILCRYLDDAGLKLPEVTDPAAFPDADEIKGWSAESVSRFQQSTIVQGDGNGFFNPGNNATRAEGAAIFTRMIKAVLAELTNNSAAS